MHKNRISKFWDDGREEPPVPLLDTDAYHAMYQKFIDECRAEGKEQVAEKFEARREQGDLELVLAYLKSRQAFEQIHRDSDPETRRAAFARLDAIYGVATSF